MEWKDLLELAAAGIRTVAEGMKVRPIDAFAVLTAGTIQEQDETLAGVHEREA